MSEAEITKNVDSWKRAFDQVVHGDELSEILDYGFDEKDLENLAEIHEKDKAYRKKIEELLTDCNFHTECEWMVKGEYDKFQNWEDVDIDELEELEDESIEIFGGYSVNSVGLVTDAILEGKDIRQVLIAGAKRKNLTEGSIKVKHVLMNDEIDKICSMSAVDFIDKYLDVKDKETVIDYIKSGFIPFKSVNGDMMELSLEDGRLEYDGTSMGGSRDLYFKIKEIKDILIQDYLN